ncbi:MAG: D-amino acid aminotransferase [Candidatus Parabeggiatoa sp. nov. 2]|nr:MAG: D-amino acid aminotransferase [Beggiatoa sp. 4572_84]RKZ63250.1 MAG: D-amino acid aminotransferase [Gammaproteobacteria bacterium]HEC85712.1 D-amino acid aminotransferase [Thioploca sp.]
MIVYLNGEFLPLDEARVPVLDRGFIFADGVYEVIPVYGGRLFRLPEHLQRLENSLKSIKLQNPLTRQQWIEALEIVVARNSGDDQSVYLQVTRGPAKRNHNFPEPVVPTVFIMSEPLEAQPPSGGVKAVTCADTRWQRCDIKSIALLANVLLRQQAVEVGAAEAILIREGYVMEGAASNVFVVVDGVAITPPKSQYILPGITRDLVVEAMLAAELACREADISEAQLRSADEIWVTSSTREIVPVIMLDDKPVGNGQPGAVWSQVWKIYQDYKQHLRSIG